MKPFYAFSRFLSGMLFKVCYGHRVKGASKLPAGAAIIAANHVSFWDPVVVGISAQEEIAFLARRSLFDNRLLGPIIRNLNAFPVGGQMQDIASLRLIEDLLKQGQKVLIFPEGQRSLDGALGHFKSGVGMLALRNCCPIVPVYIEGTFSVWPMDSKFPKLWGKTRCIFGDPIPYEPYAVMSKKKGQEALTQKLEQEIAALKEGTKR